MFPAKAGEQTPTAGTSPRLSRLAERVVKFCLVDDLNGGLVISLPGGHEFEVGSSIGSKAMPVLRLNNYRVVRSALRRGGLGFADAFINRDIECTELTALIDFYLRNREKLQASNSGLFKVRSLDRFGHLLRRNSLRGSRRNIADHYDLGNAFYQHWLDRSMTYSSGLYRTGQETLEDAQLAKLDRVRTLVSAQDGQTILEIGCGWGSFACRTAERDGTHVTGLTLSKEQLTHARQYADKQGLTPNCAFHLKDYRKVGGLFDHIVSIEMIEAVGEAYWKDYFRTLYDRLKPGGSAVLQAITISPSYFDAYRRRPDFIQRYIFPGGMLPTEAIVVAEAQRAGLNLKHTETFGASYARTLRAWRSRFEAAWPQISKLGFDDRFRRCWRYYLAYCEAGFDNGVIDVGLYKFIKR